MSKVYDYLSSHVETIACAHEEHEQGICIKCGHEVHKKWVEINDSTYAFLDETGLVVGQKNRPGCYSYVTFTLEEAQHLVFLLQVQKEESNGR